MARFCSKTCLGKAKQPEYHNKRGILKTDTSTKIKNEFLNILPSGSPFLLRVAAPPDASKVRCFGPGLEHGILSSFNGRFICETKGAGAGQLKVRIHGPKGAFKVEMRRSDTKDRTIDVRYNPNEAGEYAIQVKWSDKHVPGSPFTVKVVENREELHALKREMANGRHSGKAMTNGWSEDI